MSGSAGRVRAAWKVLTGTGAAASAGLGLLVLACVLVAVAAPRQSLGLRTRALQRSFDTAPVLTKSVAGTIDYNTFDLSYNNAPITAFDLNEAQAKVAANLAHGQVPLTPPATDWAGLSTAFDQVTGAASRAINGGAPPRLEVLYRNTLSRNVRLTAGRLPVSAQSSVTHATFGVAVSKAVAARFGLRPGSRLGVGPNITLAVTGVFTPIAPTSTFWGADANADMPTLNQVDHQPAYWIGSVFVSAGELPALQHWFGTANMQLTWNFPLNLHHLTATQGVALASSLVGASPRAGVVLLGSFRTPTAIGLTSGLASLLASFIAEDKAIGTVMGLLSVSLAVIGAVVILLAARLLAEYRSGDFAVMRARGASRRQIGLLSLRAGAVVTIPAAAAGAALAIALTPAYSDPLSWWLAGLTAFVALAGPALLAVRSHAVGSAGRRRPDAVAGRRATARRLVAEVSLAAASVGGLIVLRNQGTSTSGDLYTSAVPVLVAIPAAIVVMRCYPLAIRLLLRLAGVRNGVTAFVALARAARTSVSALLPAFALVLTLAVVAFGAMVNAAVYRGQVAASWQQMGADAVINDSASPKPITPAVVAKIDAVPGVSRTAGVFVTAGTSASGQTLGVVVLPPAEYAALVAQTPRTPFPAAKLARPGPGAPVPVLASPLATPLTGKKTTTLEIGLAKVKVRFAGGINPIPDVSGGAFVVLPAWALAASPQPPNLLLVVGPHLDEQRLVAVASRAMLGSTVTFRSHVLAGLTKAPLPHGANTAFAEVVAAAAGFSLLILLITLVLSARSREFTVARLRVMGLSQRQARWMVAVEMLPQILAAVIGGVASAWALAVLVSPAINLAAFTGTGAGVPILVEPVPLVAAAGGLVALALIALVAQVVIADKRGATRALRVSE